MKADGFGYLEKSDARKLKMQPRPANTDGFQGTRERKEEGIPTERGNGFINPPPPCFPNK